MVNYCQVQNTDKCQVACNDIMAQRYYIILEEEANFTHNSVTEK